MRKARDTLNNTFRENRTRSRHIYKVGDYAFITAGKIQLKLSAPNEGPYRINSSNQTTNGTVHLQRGPVEEKINIVR